MPQRKTAQKELRKSLKKKHQNLQAKRKVKETVKKVKKLVEEGSAEDKKKTLCLAYKTLDRGASKNIIHKNKAARKKSRLTKMLNKAAKAS